jgi:hypothetical protein
MQASEVTPAIQASPSMPDLEPSFEQFANGLKQEAEAKAAV